MLKVVSVETLRSIEASAEKNGITIDTLFERVAEVVAGRVRQWIMDVPEPRVTVLVGSGNNGADGLLVATLLAQDPSVQVGVYLVKPRAADDPYLQKVQAANLFVADAENDQQHRVLRNMVASANLIVDGIFGIGAHLPIEGDLVKVFRNIQQALNESIPLPQEGLLIDPSSPSEPLPDFSKPIIIALDCPSGVNADTGEVDKLALKADETITFIAAKTGLLLPPASNYVGQLLIATLGITEEVAPELKQANVQLADKRLVRSILPDRSESGHKGTFGKVAVVAGSINYTGAAGLASMAAYRAGAGLVTVAAPMPVISGLASQLLEPTWILLPHDMGVLSEAAAETLLKEVGTYDALLIGPGIGQEDVTRDMLLKLLEHTEQTAQRRDSRRIGFIRQDTPTEAEKAAETVKLPPLILDADALNLLAKIENWWEKLPENTIITPHPGEMARLSGLETDAVQSQRLTLAQEKAAAWKVIVVLKGAHTIIAAPDGQTTILPFKTSALATAGTGDVLAGTIAAFVGQGIKPYHAAIIGAYLHGCAGEMAEVLAGSPHNVIAGDVLDMLGDAFGELLNN